MEEDKKCKASVVSCIDFRIQETLENFLRKNNLMDECDRIELAGGVKDLNEVVGQLEISHRLHGTNEIWLFQHEDCGAYDLNKEISKHEELSIHTNDLKTMEKMIGEKIDEDITVKKFFVTLAGEVTPVV